MSKQLRIWLFVLLGTLLTSTSLLAEGVITMTTSKKAGETISLGIKANGYVSITGVKEYDGTDGSRLYTLTSQTVSIRGDVTKLDCGYNELTSLDVSKNTALTTLECGGNRLTSLDVSGYTALTELNCYGNQLTSLDLSGCTVLKEFDCGGNPLSSINLSGCQSLKKLSWNRGKLTSLDVSGCTSLTSLDCTWNQLTSLDLSDCSSLTKLDCGWNSLTSLDVSGCTSLTELSCKGNQLTSLDLSDCISLTKLDCFRNQLTNLDVSVCTALTELGCGQNQLTSLDVSGRVALTKLDCSYNHLTSLDLSGCTVLTELDCEVNPLTSVNFSNCKSLKEFSWENGKITSVDVSGCTTLTKLNCSSNQLTSLDVSSCTALTELSCRNNQLTSLDVSKNINLKSLNCGSNQLTSLDLLKNTALTELACYWNQLANLDLSSCTSLTKLDCSSNQLPSLDLSSCTSLTKLDCSSNQLPSLDLSGCTALKELKCSSNQLTSLNVSGCTALKTLECINNQLTDLDVSGCTALTTLDCPRNPLTSLNASDCIALTKIDCEGNRLISLNVSGCTALTTLDCRENQLTSLDLSGCTALTKLQCRINQLTSLELSDCISLTELDCLGNKLTSLNVSGCTSLMSLDCGSNQLTSLDLSNHIALTALDCSRNLLRKIELSGCTSLVSLTCYRNQIKVREMTNLVNSLPNLQGKGVGLFRVFCDYDAKEEGNICLAVHVATAQAKGWKTQFTRDYNGNTWYDYTGADNPVFAVTASSTSGGSISFIGADNLNAVPYGTELTVVATPADGYKLTKLTANGQDILETMRFKVTEKTEVKATFTLQAYNVTPIKLGEGTLYVSGADNLEAVAPGTELTVTATPAEGYELAKLTANDKNILDTKKVVVNEDLIIRAIFIQKTFKVSLEKRGKGTIKAVGADDLNAVPYGTELTIEATPAEGSTLTALVAGGINIIETKKVTIKKETTIEAVFTTRSFVVTLTKEGEGMVTATGADDLDAVAYGTELTIIATPAEGYELTALTANGTDILASQKVTIKEAVEVKATFTKKSFAVTLIHDGVGDLDATGSDDLKAVPYGTKLTVTATPAAGYELTALTANGKDILATKNFIVKGATEIRATFSIKHFAITQTQEGEGKVDVTGADDLNAVAYGTELTINATPAEGYELTALTANGTDILATKKVVVEGNLTVKATFTKKSFAVSLTKEGEGTISATGASNLNSVAYGTELTINATPAAGYELVSITANGTDITATKKVVVTDNLTVKATFAKKSFAVSLTKEGEGTISATGASDLNAVAYGTELTINATPAMGYELVSITAGGTDITASKKVVVTGNLTVKATFAKKVFAVSLTKEGEGTLSATGADDLKAVLYDTELTIEATPATGYELTALTANGTDILATKKVTVKEALEVKATFTKKTFAVTLTSNEHGDITIVEPVDLKAVPYGTTLTVKATGKNAQCVLTELTANGTDILATKSFVVEGETEVKATFVDHTGVETTVTQETQLYPNPATDYVIVEGVAPASEVTLHSMTGERLYAGRADDRGTLQIDLTPYADGVYLVCVAGETYRVVVSH